MHRRTRSQSKRAAADAPPPREVVSDPPPVPVALAVAVLAATPSPAPVTPSEKDTICYICLEAQKVDDGPVISCRTCTSSVHASCDVKLRITDDERYLKHDALGTYMRYVPKCVYGHSLLGPHGSFYCVVKRHIVNRWHRAHRDDVIASIGNALILLAVVCAMYFVAPRYGLLTMPPLVGLFMHTLECAKDLYAIHAVAAAFGAFSAMRTWQSLMVWWFDMPFWRWCCTVLLLGTAGSATGISPLAFLLPTAYTALYFVREIYYPWVCEWDALILQAVTSAGAIVAVLYGLIYTLDIFYRSQPQWRVKVSRNGR